MSKDRRQPTQRDQTRASRLGVKDEVRFKGRRARAEGAERFNESDLRDGENRNKETEIEIAPLEMKIERSCVGA